MGKQVFEEKQRFDQWWLWALISALIAFQIWKSFIANNEPLMSGSIGILVTLIISVCIGLLRLKTRVDEAGVHLRFFPFAHKDLSWKSIRSAKVVRYGFVGGWGVRLFTHVGTVYNTRGTKGLALKLNNGDEFCIGTQKPEELQAIIDQWTKKT